MKAIVTWEGTEDSVNASLAALSHAAGWIPSSDKSQLEFAAGLINAFVRDVTITNLKLASTQTTEELELIYGAADSISFSFKTEV